MQVYGNFNTYASYQFGFDFISSIQRKRVSPTASYSLAAADDSGRSVEAVRQVVRMQKAIEEIRSMFEANEIAARATSASSLDLSTSGTATPTTLQSTEEVNASTTGYSTDPPEWTGASTAQPTMGGEYDGSSGTDTLTFKVKKGGTQGEDLIQIQVFDSNKNQIDSLNFKKQDGVDTPQTLSNGLTVSFSNGDFVKNDSFTVEVYDSVDNVVNPDNPFNGTGASDPNFEFGLDVTSGSFEINGTTIDVAADDSINSVLDKINQSAAGVTATFDAATETVLLTQNTPGSTPDIVLSNDTSGFVAAVKLDSAVAVPGEDGTVTEDSATPLAEVDAFSTVQSGSISVNEVSIDIDVNTDSLNDILDRITASAADVTASFDSNSKKVTLSSNDAESQLILDSGSTNFFQSLEISDDTYSPKTDTRESGQFVFDPFRELENLISGNVDAETAIDDSQKRFTQTQALSAEDAQMLGTLVNVIANSMNALFDESTLMSLPSATLEQARNDMRGAVSASFASDGPTFNTDFGIEFDFENKNGRVFNFSQDNQRQLETALTTPQGLASVRDMLFGSGSSGLLEQLHGILSTAGTSLVEEVGSIGLFVDITA